MKLIPLLAVFFFISFISCHMEHEDNMVIDYQYVDGVHLPADNKAIPGFPELGGEPSDSESHEYSHESYEESHEKDEREQDMMMIIN